MLPCRTPELSALFWDILHRLEPPPIQELQVRGQQGRTVLGARPEALAFPFFTLVSARMAEL
ncbi:MAG: hypothetical protein AAFS07_19160, partial [Pseudomonadota bacterium]